MSFATVKVASTCTPSIVTVAMGAAYTALHWQSVTWRQSCFAYGFAGNMVLGPIIAPTCILAGSCRLVIGCWCMSKHRWAPGRAMYLGGFSRYELVIAHPVSCVAVSVQIDAEWRTSLFHFGLSGH